MIVILSLLLVRQSDLDCSLDLLDLRLGFLVEELLLDPGFLVLDFLGEVLPLVLDLLDLLDLTLLVVVLVLVFLLVLRLVFVLFLDLVVALRCLSLDLGQRRLSEIGNA